jgi:hypothetical protein
MRDGQYVRPDKTFVAFEKEYDNRKLAPKALCEELQRFSAHYNVIRGRRKAPTDETDQTLKILRDLYVSTSYPLVLNLLERHRKGDLTAGDLAKCIRAISGFVTRRYICGESSRAYSRWFPLACRELGDAPVDNLYAYFKGKGWPDDGKFVTSMVKLNLYASNYCRVVLETLQANLKTSEPVDLSQCTVEHILPQTIDNDDEDSKVWQQVLSRDGQDWRLVWSTWVHTIGNLTLVGYDYNTTMRNKRFEEKKVELAKSKVDLNRYFDRLDVWDAVAIEKRGIELAQASVKIWTGPEP